MQPQQVFDKGYIGGFHFRTINKEMEDRWSIIVDDDAVITLDLLPDCVPLNYWLTGIILCIFV